MFDLSDNNRKMTVRKTKKKTKNVCITTTRADLRNLPFGLQNDDCRNSEALHVRRIIS